MNTIKNLSNEAKVNIILAVIFLPIVAWGITKIAQAIAAGASTGVF